MTAERPWLVEASPIRARVAQATDPVEGTASLALPPAHKRIQLWVMGLHGAIHTDRRRCDRASAHSDSGSRQPQELALDTDTQE